MDRQTLYHQIVIPAVQSLALPSKPMGRDLAEFRLAEYRLLLGTNAVESPDFLRHQTGGGPALGIFQMEPSTHDDIWRSFLAYRSSMGQRVAYPTIMPDPYGPPWPSAQRLIDDDCYAACMARIQYARSSMMIPAATDIAAMDRMYLTVYNAGGSSRLGEFTECYNRLVAPLFESTSRNLGDTA